MNTVIYDGSFAGLLTCIYEVYEYKMEDADIHRESGASPNLFGKTHTVHTNRIKAEKVLNKLSDRFSPNAVSQFYKTFLSEIRSIENNLLRYVRYGLSSSKAIENDYSNPDVLILQQTSRKVNREKHRMEAFVRFQLTKDGLYYSIIQPDFNVLPLISKHFKDRYADQRWMIYDAIRKYGLYYDLNTVSEIQMTFDVDVNAGDQLAAVLDENEELYQNLWRQYFASVNIAARKNMKLHIRHMPKRYWKYLVEKIPVHDRLADDSQ